MTEVAGYQLGTLLGQGSFGQTYEATKDGQRVALKLIREEAIQFGFDRRRFDREVKALQKAAGPNVVRIVDAGQVTLGNELRYFVALEYLEGHDLAQAFVRANSSFDEATLKQVCTQIISGLETIHAQSIVHRDLKPANVFLTNSGEIKLLDFGLVKMLDYTTLTTVPGQPQGTPLYIAPEILRGDGVDYRADFYSLGVLIYHLATGGQYPFTAQTPLELYVKVVNNAPTPPTRHNGSLSSEFENLILDLLSKQPYERRLNHTELKEAIRAIPISIARDTGSESPATQHEIPKRCLFRLLHNEKSDVERFVNAGGTMDGINYPANYLPRYQNSLNAYRRMGLPYQFDPVTYRLPYSSFAQTEGLVNLPYVPDPDNILIPENIQTLQAQRAYARGCLDWQLQWDCSTLVAPFHFSRDLGSPWIDIDIKLLEESIAYARSIGDSRPVYAGLSLNIETFTVADNRLALLNRYSRARADGYLFYVDNVEERTDNPLQLRALLNLLQLFQRLGKPVFACRVGTLGLGLLAAGVDGMTTGVASLTGFSENTLLSNRVTGFDMQRKYYIPGMMLTLPVQMAQDLLSNPSNAYLRCDCPHCQSSFINLDSIAKAHFLHARSDEVDQLRELRSTRERISWFRQRVGAAIRACDEVRRQQLVNLRPGNYSHLRVWLQVFVEPQEAS